MNIKDYMGINIADRLKGISKECYLAAWNWMEGAWGQNVEFERLSSQILLCEETRNYLYADENPVSHYVKGERPILEKIANEVCKDCKSDREKVLAILVYVRDLHKTNDGRDFFFGGTEEELIKKGEWFCERVARIMAGLCEIMNMPSRIVFHIASGHLANEVFFEGKWAYFDPRFANFYMKDDVFLSTDEIVKNREIVFEQSNFVNGFRSDFRSLDYARHRAYNFYFSPKETQCIGDYSLMDAKKYHFDWVPVFSEGKPNERTIHSRYAETGLMQLI